MATKVKLTEEEREAKRETERAMVKDSIEQLRSSEGWQNWLRSRSKFHHYSLHNQLLIALQAEIQLDEGWVDRMPVRVAGFRKWLDLGYCVRKRPEDVPAGAWAIKIWAHMDPSKKQIAEAKANGERKPSGFFRLVSVFGDNVVDVLPDFENPVPLAPPLAEVEGDSLQGAWEPLCALVRECGATIDLEDSMQGAGYLRPSEMHIGILASQSVNARVSTLIHELGHLLVRVDKQDGDPEFAAGKEGYAQEELVVESVAMSVSGTLGLDTAGASIPYLTSWAERADVEVLEKTAKLVNRLASRIEDAMPEELVA